MTTPRYDLTNVAHIMAIDPGLQGTGWALWTRSRFRSPFPPAPRVVGVYVPPGGPLLVPRMEAVTNHLFHQWNRYAVSLGDLAIAIEEPEWQGSAKRAMTWTTGDMQKLCFLVGWIGGWFYEFGPTFMIPVRTWKGQLPKDIVKHRVQRDLGLAVCEKLNITTHAWDAVGIGLHVLEHCSAPTK